jgi:hypothetical protein
MKNPQILHFDGREIGRGSHPQREIGRGRMESKMALISINNKSSLAIYEAFPVKFS